MQGEITEQFGHDGPLRWGLPADYFNGPKDPHFDSRCLSCVLRRIDRSSLFTGKAIVLLVGRLIDERIVEIELERLGAIRIDYSLHEVRTKPGILKQSQWTLWTHARRSEPFSADLDPLATQIHEAPRGVTSVAIVGPA